jgi:hypothetical protein
LLGAGLARGKLRRPSWLLIGLASPLWWVANALSQPLPRAHHEDEELALTRGPRVGSFGVERRAHELYDRIREVTPEHASFLISPSLLGFRLHTRRAAYVDWKCAPMKGVEALEWERRMLAVLGLTEFPNFGYDLRTWSEERYNRRNLQLLADLARREQLDFVIASRRSPPPASAGLEAYFTAGHWRVYRVRSLEEMRNMPAPEPGIFP